MNRIRLTGRVLIAVFMLGVLGASSAMAEEGGNPEILPTPSASEPLTFTSESTGPPKLITTSGTVIECEKGTGKGELTSARLGKGTAALEGCKDRGTNCTSTGDATGVVLSEGKVSLVDVLPTGTLDLGVWAEALAIGGGDLKAKCGLLSIEALGSAIGVAENEHGELLKDLERAKTFIGVSREEKQGEQQVKTCMLPKEFCEGKTFETKVGFGKGEELVAGVGTGTVKFAKEIEVHF